ncbi:MAG: ABC transporter ATP-binding protein [Candidatus Bipolaricaulia bacterium]
MSSHLLQTTRLTQQFGAFLALDGVDLALPPREVRAVIGPNGAGKTTLVNALSGSIRPTSGRIYFNDRKITRWPMARRARAGLVRTFQTSALFPGLSVRAHVEMALGHGRLRLNRHGALQDQIMEVAERAGFADRQDALVKTMSHGERRRLALEMALAMAPTILMLDEPMAGLTRDEAQSLIDRLRQLEEVTLLIIEHDMDVVFRLADRITVLHRGAVLAEGTPSAIQDDADVQAVYLGRDGRAGA